MWLEILVALLVCAVGARWWQRRRGRRDAVAAATERQRWVGSESKQPSRILLVAYGTRGDVQPIVCLAKALRRAGVQVCVCAPDRYRAIFGNEKLRYVSCGVESVELKEELFKKNLSFRDVLGEFSVAYPVLGKNVWKCCEDFDPNVLVSQVLTSGICRHIAMKRGIPTFSVHCAPSNTPTSEFPAPGFTARTWIPFRFTYALREAGIVLAAVRCGLAREDVSFRRDFLKLPPLSLGDTSSDVYEEPALHMYSPVLCEKPADWPEWHSLCGDAVLSRRAAAADDAGVDAFLNGDGMKVYVGFGSLSSRAHLARDRAMEAAAASARDTDVKFVVLGSDNSSLKNVLFVSQLDHHTHLPKFDLAIHHGGSGTTHACVRAGVPQLIIPVLSWADQQFWGSRVVALGLGRTCDGGDMRELSATTMELMKNLAIFKETCAKARDRLLSLPDGADVAAARLLERMRAA